MCKRLFIVQSAVLLLCLALFTPAPVIGENQPDTSYQISAIHGSLVEDSLSLLIQGNTPPAYTVYELYNPSRLVIDIAQATINDAINLEKVLPANGYATMAVQTLSEQDPPITRFEITISTDHKYKVDKQDNDLLVVINPEKSDSSQASGTSTAMAAPAPKAGTAMSRSLNDITVNTSGKTTEVIFHASGPIEDFTHNTVAGSNGLPDRMFIDVNNIDGSKLDRQKNVGGAVSTIRVASRGTGVRIVFDSAINKMFPYDVTTDPSGLKVMIGKSSKAKPTAAKQAEPAKAVKGDETLSALIDSSAAALANEKSSKKGTAEKTAEEKFQDKFQFSGYKDNRISVDFYKIDLHNVFRLFREISDVNIIVEESVKGTLTLALNDVPWTFALDVILNLKDLKKEERFNTIVIYPAKDTFTWPERASENLSFEADAAVVEQEALIIQQSASQPKEIMQAKELIRRAKIEEKNDDVEDAAALYEEAFKLWPKNAKLSNRLATLYLANLGMNAKAVYYAEKSLKAEPKNTRAALYAAIGNANMGNVAKAGEYFSQSISDDIPMKEALISYATFSEENNHPEAALKLLDRYHAVYGESVDTMIAKARILDQTGQTAKANEQYRALLGSGFQLVPGLKDYIRQRLASSTN